MLLRMTGSRKKRASKKTGLPPRRLRMKRQGRLMAAASFLRKFSGKNVVRGYSRWFGVDLGCALKELQMLGVHVDLTYADRLRATLRDQERIACQRSERRRQEEQEGANTDAWFDLEATAFAEGAISPLTDIPF